MAKARKNPTWLGLQIDEDINDLLNTSAAASNRSKRQEVYLRLKDHLIRYKAISAVGETLEREEGK